MYTHNMKCYLNTLIGFGDKAYKQTDTTFVQFLHFARKFHFLWYVERSRYGAPTPVTT